MHSFAIAIRTPIGRYGGCLAGLPVSPPGVTVNRHYASGMGAIAIAARAIPAGDYHLAIAGGIESTSRVPFVSAKASASFSRRVEVYDTTIGWRFVNSKMDERYGADSMPQTADNVAAAWNISPRGLGCVCCVIAGTPRRGTAPLRSKSIPTNIHGQILLRTDSLVSRA